MSLIRHFIGPLLVLGIFITATILGLITAGAGWIALSLLCAWPLLWAVTAWTIRGFKDSYKVVPKQNARKERNGIPAEAAQW